MTAVVEPVTVKPLRPVSNLQISSIRVGHNSNLTKATVNNHLKAIILFDNLILWLIDKLICLLFVAVISSLPHKYSTLIIMVEKASISFISKYISIYVIYIFNGHFNNYIYE